MSDDGRGSASRSGREDHGRRKRGGRDGRNERRYRDDSLDYRQSPRGNNGGRGSRGSRDDHRGDETPPKQIPKETQGQILEEIRKVAKGLESSFSKRVEKVESKMDEHEDSIIDHETRLKALEEEFAAWKAAQESMGSQNAQRGGAGSKESEFEAEPPAGSVKVTAQSPFARAVLEPALAATLGEANLGMQDCSIIGKGVKRRFDILFNSSTAAKQFLDSMQEADGTWKPFHVTDHKESRVQIYYSPLLSWCGK